MADQKTLARLATAARLWHPDWVEKSVRSYLVENHAGESDYELTVAAIACWADPYTNTPARLRENGPWHRAAAAAASLERGALNGPPKRGQDCSLHPGEWGDACRCCAADRLVEQREAAS